jgi:hypothetical protein
MRVQYFILLTLTITSFNSFAGDFKSGGSVVIDKPQHHDLYITAGTVVINAPVYGDLIITGGNVTINDSVAQDILVAGGRVLLNGFVGDDVRCAGGKITVTSSIAGDLVAAGGVIDLQSNSTIGSVTVTGGDVTLAGTCTRMLNVAAGKFTLTGTVGENVVIKGGNLFLKGTIKGKASLAASEDIKIYSSARIDRGIKYWLPFKRPLEISGTVSKYTPIYDPLLSITHSKWYFLGASTFLGLMWYLGMAFILILLLQYLFGPAFFRSGIKMHTKPVKSALVGLGYFICVPISAVFLLATIVGLPLTIILSFVYITSVLMATIISSVVIVNWISFISIREYSLIKMSGMGLMTFALLKILTFTPFFGSVLMVLIAMTSFGAVITSIRWKRISTTAKMPDQSDSVTLSS